MTITIGRRPVGPGSPVLVIAEAGVNHNGDAGLAHQLVAAAASAEADAVKFQTFDPDELATPAAAKAAYQQGSAGESPREMLRELVLPTSAWRQLKEDAESRGLIFLSTPFDLASLRMLVDIQVPALKVSSADLDNTPLLRQIAGAGKPVLLSTGMATLGEISQALNDLGAARSRTILLHCVSAYPAPLEECNLR